MTPGGDQRRAAEASDTAPAAEDADQLPGASATPATRDTTPDPRATPDPHATSDEPGATRARGDQRRSWWRTALQAVLGTALAVALLVWGLPYFAETSWSALLAHLDALSWGNTIGLFVLMVVALWCYTFTLTGSLAGLTHPQALMVNVAGSAAGNLLPGGGAMGAAATYGMYRSWGFTPRDISTSLIVSGVWNVLGRMALPVLGISVLLIAGEPMPPGVARGGAVGALLGLGLLGWFVAVIASERVATTTGHVLDRLIGPLVRRLSRRSDGHGVDGLVADLRSRIGHVVESGWLPMTFGLVGFFGFQYLLFIMCLRATGVELSLAHFFAAFAVGRLLTAVGVTPGGVGVTEAGTAIALVGFGAAHAPAAAGIVLFTIYTHLLELPLGALGALIWWLTKGRYADRRPATT
ncbi:lysylphosphatidylglycerol synthase domain-containing protein [Arsenicicoccus bolidensis]|uniref:lysylphosphatidylglycerol synthase domain-containing protein n=1 Tax=Arsenicicoccus bolidensis TaxID=229480 RepID=UPI0028AB5FDF|nr:lysylphosphatidylglycerol synthase domain-containing protein [Arsenicicoccus bolidensis]